VRLEERSKWLLAVSILLLAPLPIGILLAIGHEYNPAVPTMPGIEYGYLSGVDMEGSVTVNYEDGGTRIYLFNTAWEADVLSIYSRTGKKVSSITVNPVKITVFITTDDPTATCTVDLGRTLKWSATASGKAETLENQASKVTLTYAQQRKSVTTSSYTLPSSDFFPASPSEGQSSVVSGRCDATAKFTFTGVAPPSPFTETGSGSFEGTYEWRSDQGGYTYEGGVVVEGSGSGGGGDGDLPYYCPVCGVGFDNLADYKTHMRVIHGWEEDDPLPASLLPMKSLELSSGERKALYVSPVYVGLEIIGVCLVGYIIYVEKIMDGSD